MTIFLVTIFVLLFLVLDFGFCTLLFKGLCWAFGWAFTWHYAVGFWIILLVLQAIFGAPRRKS